MTVTNQTAFIVAEGNDAATEFSFHPMVIPDSADQLHVFHRTYDDNGVQNVERIYPGSGANNYRINFQSEFPSTGSITYPAYSGADPLPEGEELVMERVIELLQPTDFAHQGKYYPVAIENQMDRIVMMIQQVGAFLKDQLVAVFSVEDKAKLDAITDGTHYNVHSDWTETDPEDFSYIENKPDLKPVATSGSYDDLRDKPVLADFNIHSDVTGQTTVIADNDKGLMSDISLSGQPNRFFTFSTLSNYVRGKLNSHFLQADGSNISDEFEEALVTDGFKDHVQGIADDDTLANNYQFKETAAAAGDIHLGTAGRSSDDPMKIYPRGLTDKATIEKYLKTHDVRFGFDDDKFIIQVYGDISLHTVNNVDYFQMNYDIEEGSAPANDTDVGVTVTGAAIHRAELADVAFSGDYGDLDVPFSLYDDVDTDIGAAIHDDDRAMLSNVSVTGKPNRYFTFSRLATYLGTKLKDYFLDLNSSNLSHAIVQDISDLGSEVELEGDYSIVANSATLAAGNIKFTSAGGIEIYAANSHDKQLMADIWTDANLHKTWMMIDDVTTSEVIEIQEDFEVDDDDDSIFKIGDYSVVEGTPPSGSAISIHFHLKTSHFAGLRGNFLKTDGSNLTKTLRDDVLYGSDSLIAEFINEYTVIGADDTPSVGDILFTDDKVRIYTGDSISNKNSDYANALLVESAATPTSELNIGSDYTASISDHKFQIASGDTIWHLQGTIVDETGTKPTADADTSYSVSVYKEPDKSPYDFAYLRTDGDNLPYDLRDQILLDKNSFSLAGTYKIIGNSDVASDDSLYITSTAFLLYAYTSSDQTNIKKLGYIHNQVNIEIGDDYVIEGSASTITENANAVIWGGFINSEFGTKPSSGQHNVTIHGGVVHPVDLEDVAFTGSYDDLDDTPDLADVATSGSYDDLDDTPDLADIATSGSYDDLSDVPTFGTPTVHTANVSGAVTLDAHDGDFFEYTLTGNVTGLDVSNLAKGRIIEIMWRQDSTGNRTLTMGDGIGLSYVDHPTLGTSPHHKDIMLLQKIQSVTQLVGFLRG